LGEYKEKGKGKLSSIQVYLDFVPMTLYQWLHILRQDGRIIDEYTDDFYQLVGESAARNDLLKLKSSWLPCT